MYCVDLQPGGADRPRGPPAQRVFNLTDDEALEQLALAPGLDIEETHLPQKTLHNFRLAETVAVAFQETTDSDHPGIWATGKQRLDSTHIMSIATLTRLGLFCETCGCSSRWEHPEPLRPGVPEGLLRRYLKEEDEAAHYNPATPFGLCPGPLPAGGPVPWHDCCPAGGVPAAGAAAAGAVPCGQTPGRAPQGR